MAGSAVRLVSDAELSPLDLTIAPGGNLVVSSEWPFGSPSVSATIQVHQAPRTAVRAWGAALLCRP
jgi:hypothetical protein